MKLRNLFFSIFFSSFLLLSFFFLTESKARSKRKASSLNDIYKINIQGYDKIKEDYVRSKISSKIGTPYSLKEVNRDVKELFKTGYYYDVAVDKKVLKQGIVLTYYLKERPFISSLEYKGNLKIKQEDLEEVSEIKAYEILNRTKLNQTIKKFKDLYEEKGYFLAEINYEIKDKEAGKSVHVVFHIKENDKVKVKKITFLGNKYFSSEKLKLVMLTKEDSFFSFLRKAESYKQEVFDRDIQVLLYVYQNEGFIQAQVFNPEIFITPDKKSIYITFQIEEGKRFKVGEVKFAGDLLFPRKELRESTKIKTGEFFSYQKLQEDLRTLQAKYGDLGYAFANPIPRTLIRDQDDQVDLIFEIEKGYQVSIDEIHIFGNDKTRDKVIRRELRIREGELYHETRKRLSEVNVRRLGLFEEVAFLNKTSVETPDQVDIEIRVKERSTGTANVGLTYAQSFGVQFEGTLSQNNFLGYGNRVEFLTRFNQSQQLFQIDFLDRYFLDTLWEFGVDLYMKKYARFREYFNGEKERYGGRLRIGRPLSDDWRVALSYRLEKSILSWLPIWKEAGIDLYTGGLTQSLTGYLIYDRRDDRLMPSKGIYSLNSLEYAGFLSDLNFIKGMSIFQYFHPVVQRVVWRNNLSYQFLHFNDSREDKYYAEMFRLGGPQTLRGYGYNSIGKVRDRVSNRASGQQDIIIGGKQQIFYQTELQALLIKESKIFGVLFYDVGSSNDHLRLHSVYHNVGFGVRVLTPIGFLRFEWAYPLSDSPYSSERDYLFIFHMAPSF